MARLAARLVGPVSRAVVGPTTEYTAPALSTTFVKSVVRQVQVTAVGVPTTVQLSIGALAAGTLFLITPSIPAGTTQSFNFNDLAVEAGEIIQSSVSGVATIVVLGANIVPSS